MVEVRFAFIGSIEGVKCTLDGVMKYSNSSGFCSFFGVSQGAHTYSVSKIGMDFVSGTDAFGRELSASGITVIEWVPAPEVPWPETQPWIMLITLSIQPSIDTSITINGPAMFYLDEPFMVHGFLRDSGGNPLEGLTVKLFIDNEFIIQENTQSDGNYAFNLILSELGDHTLTVCYGCVSASLRLGKP